MAVVALPHSAWRSLRLSLATTAVHAHGLPTLHEAQRDAMQANGDEDEDSSGKLAVFYAMGDTGSDVEHASLVGH